MVKITPTVYYKQDEVLFGLWSCHSWETVTKTKGGWLILYNICCLVGRVFLHNCCQGLEGGYSNKIWYVLICGVQYFTAFKIITMIDA